MRIQTPLYKAKENNANHHKSQPGSIPANVLICQDIVRGYNKKHVSPRCMLKINLQKAFDSVHWDFLKELLKELKFPEIFIKWTMECVTSVQFNIRLNDQDWWVFEGGWGIGEGDPLSPLLFVI